MSLLEVKGLTKSFGSKMSVDSISFTLQPHTATALIGPNGAGKTTTMSMIIGLLAQTSGTVLLEGSSNIRQHVGFLPQYPKFYPWLTALEYVEMVAGLSHVPKREIRARSKQVLQYVGLEKDMNRLTSTFSGGMKQRLGIAQAIVHQPKLLLLDEPVSALDPIGRAEVMELLKLLQQQTTILYSTHILHDAEKMTDQVLFMKQGKLVEQGSLSAIQLRYADPKYAVQFANQVDASQFASGYPTARCEGSTVLLEVDETLPTMQVLMSQVSSTGLEVIKLERVSASLDQIFMKVAGEREVLGNTVD